MAGMMTLSASVARQHLSLSLSLSLSVCVCVRACVCARERVHAFVRSCVPTLSSIRIQSSSNSGPSRPPSISSIGKH